MRWGSPLAVSISGTGLMAFADAPPEPPERLVYLALGASDAAGIGPSRSSHRQIADRFLDVILPALNLAPTV